MVSVPVCVAPGQAFCLWASGQGGRSNVDELEKGD